MKRFALVLSLSAIWGCSFDVDANPGQRCDDLGQCPGGLTCHRGFCVGMGECGNEGAVVECYDESLELVGVGACRAGEQVCANGVLSACLGQVLPRAEICNGVDDDCNGTVDDIAGMNCDSGMDGLCASGVLECRQGSALCVPDLSPEQESCSGTDQDCDGVTDEGTNEVCFPEGGLGCTLGDDGSYECEGRCSSGQRVCAGGVLGDCQDAVLPADSDGCTPPGTTAIDDNCNGQTDEECVCVSDDTQDCYGGPSGTEDVGACVGGVQTCEGESFGACVGEVTPTAETCGNDGVDNDCDGVADNVPLRGESCVDAEAEGICRTGVQTCMEGALVCVTPSAGTETCNDLDDDCDGDTDEGFVFATDRNHCGMCGNVCAAGLECCGGACINTQTVEAHCGVCDNDCGAGQECCGGGCLNIQSDRLNCGGCGNECDDGWDCCGGVCADTRANPANCGVCGRECDGTLTCCDGVCALPTAPACTDCAMDCAATGLTCCGVSCVDRTTDENNCGGCGIACESGQVCCDGGCVGNDELHCGQSCTACGAGDLCCDSACVEDDAANCTSCGTTCGGGETCCGDGCFNLQTDATRCGDCGAPSCTSGQICSAGHCCPSGQEWCGGACVNTTNDNNNCGACGNVCAGLCSCSSSRCSGICF